MTTNINAVDTTSINELSAALQTATDKLTRTIGTLDQELEAVSLERVDDALASTENAFENIGQAAEEVRALIKDVRQVVAALKTARVARVAEQLEASSLSVERAVAHLPSTSRNLSATIWLLNILASIGIVLGVLLLMQRHAQRKA